MLFGRSTEQARLTEVLDAAVQGSSRVVVVRGEPGIGKSALLDWLASESPSAPFRKLRLAGVEAEATLPFAGLSQLVWPLRHHLATLSPTHAAALQSVLGAAPSGGTDRLAIGLALLALLAQAAEDQPLLCLVDDAQWMDDTSSDALAFASRRLAGERLVMMFARRDAGPALPGALEIDLDRLDRDAAQQILAERHLSTTAGDRVLHVADGNPLAVIELASAREEIGPGGDLALLPALDGVSARYRYLVGRLPEATRLVTLVAATEGGRSVATVAAAADRLGADIADLADAETAGLVHTTGDRITFRHPLLTTTVYQEATATQRAAVHRVLADLSTDPTRRAFHLAAGTLTPDPAVAKEVAEEGHGLAHRGAPSPAAHLLERAAQLTSDSSERTHRLLAAADAALAAGRPSWATALAEATTPGSAVSRAERLRVLGYAEFEQGDPKQAATLLVQSASQAKPDRAARLLATAAAFGWFATDPTPITVAATDLESLGHDDDMTTGLADVVAGRYTTGIRRLTAVVEQATTRGPADPDLLLHGAYAGVVIGDDDATLAITATAITAAREQHDIGRLPRLLHARAAAEFRAGLHKDAKASADEAITLARDAGMTRRAEAVEVALAWPAAVEGEEDLVTSLPPPHNDTGWTSAQCARGLLDLGLGRPDAALRRLMAAFTDPGNHVTVVVAAIGDLVEAAYRLGVTSQVREQLARFDEWARAGHQPWAHAVAARSRALLDPSDDAFQAALELHRLGGRPFERARTELLYGSWLRRARRTTAAQDVLRHAEDGFARLGANPWLDQAQAELRAAGARTRPASPTAARPTDRLTTQELRVVRLAAAGQTSREIGDHLFLSRRTVEYHLYKAYPKLGIRSRRELARVDLT